MARQYDPAGGRFDRRPASAAAATHSHAATDVTSGTLSTDRYSAYADLSAETKIGTGAAQVAAGDHTHAYAAASHEHAATDITSGTLSTDRYSAYGDLTAESKVGTGSTQVAAGDHTHTSLGALSLSGQLTLTGSGRVKKEIYIPVARLTVGSSAPTQTTRAVGASGSIKIPVLSFSKTTSQETYFEVHMPTDVDGSVNVTFHLMWVPGAAWSAGNYMWKLDYLVKEETGVVNVGTPTTIAMDVTPSDAVTCIETEFTDSIDIAAEQVLWARLWRDVANDNGDDTGEVRFCELEYVANVLGEAVT